MRLAVLLLLAGTARAHPLDRFLAAAEGAEVVVLIPRLENLTEPLGGALRRARQVPSLTPYLGAADALPWGLLDPDLHQKNGIDPKGAFAYAKMPAGPVLRIPVTGRGAVEGLLASFGRTVTPEGDGWRTDEGVAVYRDGGLFGAGNHAILQPFLGDRESRDALARCPRGPGEADLYVWARAETGRGCLTVRVDADRLRVEARGGGLPDRWFGVGDGALLARVGADSTGLVSLHLAPAALAKGVADERVKPLAAAFDGRVAVGAGPALGVATLVFGLADEAAARRELTTHAAALGLVAEGPDTWSLKPKPMEIKGVPPIEGVFVGLRQGALLVTTRRVQLEATPAWPALATGMERAVVAVANRTGGRPHAGHAAVDALAPVLGSGAESMKPWIYGLAWVGGHLGAWAVTVVREGADVRLQAEVEVL